LLAISTVYMCSIGVSASSSIAKPMQQTRHLSALHLAALKAELPYITSIRQTRRTTLHSSVIVRMALRQVHRIYMR